jgi:hypothetical protein
VRGVCEQLDHRDWPRPVITPNLEDSLSYELHACAYHSRSTWLEEMVQPQELLRLPEAPELRASASYVPIEQWLTDSGHDPRQQWRLGFALGSVTNAWDETRSPYHLPGGRRRRALGDRPG